MFNFLILFSCFCITKPGLSEPGRKGNSISSTMCRYKLWSSKISSTGDLVITNRCFVNYYHCHTIIFGDVSYWLFFMVFFQIIGQFFSVALSLPKLAASVSYIDIEVSYSALSSLEDVISILRRVGIIFYSCHVAFSCNLCLVINFHMHFSGCIYRPVWNF